MLAMSTVEQGGTPETSPASAAQPLLPARLRNAVGSPRLRRPGDATTGAPRMAPARATDATPAIPGAGDGPGMGMMPSDAPTLTPPKLPSGPSDTTPSIPAPMLNPTGAAPSLNTAPGTPVTPNANGTYAPPGSRPGDMTAGQGMGTTPGEQGVAATPLAPVAGTPSTQPLTTSPTPGAIPPLPTGPAAAMPTGARRRPGPIRTTATAPGAVSAPPVTTTPIDPANDLRSQSVLPTDSPLLANARGGMVAADQATSAFDRTKAIRDAMAAFGTDAPAPVAGGPAVTAGPSEQGALDTLNGQVGSAAGKLAAYDRTAAVGQQRDDLSRFFGNTDVAQGPQFDPGKDYTGDLNTADAATMGALGKVTGTDRGQLTAGLRDQLGAYFGPTAVQAGGAIDPTTSARLTKYNTMLDDSASKLAGVDRVRLAKDALSQFDDAALPEHELALRKATEKFAAMGGGRSGMLRTEYGNLDLTRQRDRDLMQRKLITDATEGSIQDQFNKTSALSGLQSGLAGQEAAARGEARTERGYTTDVNTGNVTRGLATKEAAAGLAANQAGATIADHATALDAARGLSGDLSSRQQVRGATQRADQATRTAIETGNVNRGLSTKEAIQGAASAGADAGFGQSSSALSALAGLQGATAGREAGRRGEQRTERDTATGLAERNTERTLAAGQANKALATNVAAGSAADLAARRGSASDLFGTLANEGANARTETRGERATQTAMEQQAYERSVLQHQMEQDQLDRDQQRALGLLGAGESGNPSGTLATLSGAGGLDAGMVAQLAQALGRGKGGGAPAGGGTTGSPLDGLPQNIIDAILKTGTF